MIPRTGVIKDDSKSKPTHAKTFKACPKSLDRLNKIMDKFRYNAPPWVTTGGGNTGSLTPGGNRNCATHACDISNQAGFQTPSGINTPGELVDTGALSPIPAP